MTEAEKIELLTELEKSIQQLEHLKQLIADLVPEKEWYDAREAALKAGIKRKTVYNKISADHYDRVHKKNGKTLIHKSELE